MDSLLELFYDTMSHQLTYSPDYERGLHRWQALKPSLDLEDAARSREYEWGYLTFLAGIRFGISLFQESE